MKGGVVEACCYHTKTKIIGVGVAGWLVVNIAYLVLWNVLLGISYITQPLISLQVISHPNPDVMSCLLSTERAKLYRADTNHDEISFERQKKTPKNFPDTIFHESARQASSYTIYYATGLTIQTLPR
jgi:hypothetical protein